MKEQTMKKMGIMGNSNAMYTDSFVPITELVKVKLADIDDLAYFAGTVGQQKEADVLARQQQIYQATVPPAASTTQY